uniref:Acid phosphatase n=1 Tax=Panagrolaimus sp. JU765 TaxID=591449 RepID=A0AC34Q9L4_9BILA
MVAARSLSAERALSSSSVLKMNGFVNAEKVHTDEGKPVPAPVRASSDPKNKKLIFAHAIWRHGKRNPGVIYKNSLSKEHDFIQGMGELVNEGMMEQYVLGQRLRKRFIEDTALVSPHYVAKEIYIRSTHVNRTITSAQSHFRSFYSGTLPDQEPNVPSRENPVAVHAFSDLADPILLASGCEYARHFVTTTIQNKPQFKAFIDEHKQFIKTVADKTGHPEYAEAAENYDFWNTYRLLSVCDAIIHEVLLNLPRAPWVDEVYEQADNFVDEYYAHIYGLRADDHIRKEAAKIFGGPLLWEIIDRFKLKLGIDVDKIRLKDEMPEKYYVYSAHDTSIIQLFVALGFGKIGVDTIKRPQTSDAVTIELWQGNDGSNVIKIFYFRKGLDHPIDLSKTVAGCENCEEGCSLDQFIQRSLPFKPDPDAQYGSGIEKTF